MVKAVDILCENGKTVYAPFDGQMYFWRPLGGREEEACADSGARIEGDGQWQGNLKLKYFEFAFFHHVPWFCSGYFALIAFVELDFYGGFVKKGEKIGKSKDIRCLGSSYMSLTFQSFVQMKLYKQGKNVDPTYHLKDCE